MPKCKTSSKALGEVIGEGVVTAIDFANRFEVFTRHVAIGVHHGIDHAAQGFMRAVAVLLLKDHGASELLGRNDHVDDRFP
jgi:hypothetical protein